MREVIQAADQIDKAMTYFELLTAAALKHFADQAVDIAIIEVGLGGRLDSTNVIPPEITVITTIDLDTLASSARASGDREERKSRNHETRCPLLLQCAITGRRRSAA